jgi:hypothetical protein
MPLVEFLKEFELDAELIGRDREMCAGLARAHARQANSVEVEDTSLLHRLAAATEHRRAAAHSVLLSDRRAAVDHFRHAGESYCRIGNPYGLLMFAGAEYSPGDLAGPAREYGFFEGRLANRLQAGYLALAAAAGGWHRDYPARHGELVGGSLGSPIGAMAVPVGAYLDLARALETGEGEPVARTLLPFLSAHSNAMARAKENNYHWRIMAMPFHPAEPDILSVIFLVEGAMRRRGEGFLLDVLRRMPLVPDSANLLYNAVLERFGDRH